MSKLTKLFGGRQSSGDIATAIAKAQAELESAESAVVAAETAYNANLLTADKKSLRSFLDAKVEAQIDIDTARARLERLERDHETALEAEAADERQRRYDEAKAASEAAEKRLRQEYPRAATAIRELLAELAAASIAIREANADRPEGAPPLFDPEHSRSQHNLYQEVLSEDVVWMWCEIDGASPIREDLQRNVRAHEKHRRGMMTDRTDSEGAPLTYGSVQTEHGHLEVVRKCFRRTKFLPDVGGHHIAPLAGEIVLPALDASATPFWISAHNQQDAAAQAASELKPAPKRPERVPEFSYSQVKT